MLAEITRMAAELEANAALSLYRFGASRAYYGIVQERIRTLGIDPAQAMSAEEGQRWIAAEHDKWAKLIRDKGIRAE